MKDFRLREKVVGQPRDPRPRQPVLLAASPERAHPGVFDVVKEGVECRHVSRHGMVREVPLTTCATTAPARGSAGASPSQLLLDLLSFACWRSPRDFRLTINLARRVRSQMKTKPRNLKVSGLPSPCCARLSTAWRPTRSGGSFRMQRQREVLEPITHRIPEAPGVRLVLEADDDVVGIPHDDHVARGLAPSPALDPEIEHVVQVDVAKVEGSPTLARPVSLTVTTPSSVHPPSPFLDQADDAWVADPMLEESYQPTLADFIEKGSDIRVWMKLTLLSVMRPPERPAHHAGRARVGTLA